MGYESPVGRALALHPFRVWTAILLLLAACHPAHVAGLVMAVIVNAVDRVRVGRPSADIGEKRAVGIAPTVAHGNPAPAVVAISGGAGVEAPRLDCVPAHVFGRDLVSFAVSATVSSGDATTTFRRFVFPAQASRSDLTLFTAVTATSPQRAARDSSLRALDNNEQSESLAGKVVHHSYFNPERI